MESSHSELSFSMDGSQLLDVSGGLPSESDGADDLSLSDLSLDQTIRVRAPLSLFSRPQAPTRAEGTKTSDRLADLEDLADEGEGEDGPRHEEEDDEGARRRAAKVREEKLQSDIFVLKKLNSVFASFNEALDETGSANERVAAQLEETDALLNKYVNILSKTEEYARLVFDEEWYGADADEQEIELERIEQARREAEAIRERELAAQLETERLEREEKERFEREEKERLDAGKRERAATRGGIRGVRGTRASMRRTRAAPPPRPASSTNTARPRPSVAPGASSGIPVKRGTPTGTGISRGTTPARGGLSRRT